MFNIFVTSRDIEYGDIWQFIKDTCLFTSRDIGYLLPPYTSLTSFTGFFFREIFKKKALRRKKKRRKKALKMTSQLVIFKSFFFLSSFFVSPTLNLKKKSHKSTNKKILALQT